MLEDAGDLAGSEALLQDLLDIRRRVYGRTSRVTRAAAHALAAVCMSQGLLTSQLQGMSSTTQGHFAGAVALYREILASTPAKDHEHT